MLTLHNLLGSPFLQLFGIVSAASGSDVPNRAEALLYGDWCCELEQGTALAMDWYGQCFYRHFLLLIPTWPSTQ